MGTPRDPYRWTWMKDRREHYQREEARGVPMEETVSAIDPLAVAADLRAMADSFRDVGQQASRDRHRRASGRFGRRAARLYLAADVIEMLAGRTKQGAA